MLKHIKILTDWSTDLTCWGYASREYQVFTLFFPSPFQFFIFFLTEKVQFIVRSEEPSQETWVWFPVAALYLAFSNYCLKKINGGKIRKQSLGLITQLAHPFPLASEAAVQVSCLGRLGDACHCSPAYFPASPMEQLSSPEADGSTVPRSSPPCSNC